MQHLQHFTVIFNSENKHLHRKAISIHFICSINLVVTERRNLIKTFYPDKYQEIIQKPLTLIKILKLYSLQFKMFQSLNGLR